MRRRGFIDAFAAYASFDCHYAATLMLDVACRHFVTPRRQENSAPCRLLAPSRARAPARDAAYAFRRIRAARMRVIERARVTKRAMLMMFRYAVVRAACNDYAAMPGLFQRLPAL